MLTSDDIPTIRHAIDKRLDKERGVKIIDTVCYVGKDHIRVSVFMTVGELYCSSDFDLPLEFEHSHLLNEIDEIAEHCKEARAKYWRMGRHCIGETAIHGSGLRGRWRQYGLRAY